MQCENMVGGKRDGKEIEVAFLQCENMVGGKRDGKEIEVAFLQCENMVYRGETGW